MREYEYTRGLIKRIKERIPGCEVLENDPRKKQGIPDLLIVTNVGWAMLEVKISQKAPRRPNQEYWIDRFGEMGYSAFVYPENEEVVLSELQFALGHQR